MKRVPSKQRNNKIRHERDARAIRRLSVLLCCGLVLAGGFVFAARQHFAAVQYGYQSESLRREREKLVQEQQHLMLEREQAFAPARLESEARGLGLRPLLASQLGTPRVIKQNHVPRSPALLNPSASFQR